ncbi:hypothetical protein [Bradyrhizobium sp.]|uniref:hypothetical protein n=1 Tax=Bradyrhizobium sp. TaxID=376 RepID=UPI0025C386CF|nr:hypothetical protein [Bradyrhizobium sp.]
MQYLDEALKLDVRSLMAVAMKTGKQSAYSITLSCPTGQVICRDLRSSPDRVATVSITVNWPTKTGDPVSGGIFLTFRGWADRATEQTLYLSGTPAKVGGWLWRATCPETRQSVQALYLAPDGDRFLSRDATGLKYRRADPGAARYLRRCFKLAQKLKTDHFGPGIGKPRGMSDRTFDKLEWQLKKEHIRYLCAILKKTDPEFHDEDPVAPKRPPLSALRRAPRVNCSNYSRDKSGAIKLGARLETKFGTWTRDHK